MPLSYEQYPANGVADAFSVPFEYLERDHVHVYVDGVEDTAFTWDNDTQVRTSSVPPAGALVLIRRETPFDVRLVDFTDSSILDELTLDTADKHVFFIVQEAKEAIAGNFSLDTYNDVWDAQGKRVANLANPINPQDAVPLSYIDGGLTSIITEMRDEVEADRAEVATLAEQTATNAGMVATILESLGNPVVGIDVLPPLTIDRTNPAVPVIDLNEEALAGGLTWLVATPVTPETGKGYAVNTTGGAVEITLPASPEPGRPMGFMDIAGAFHTNNLILRRNGNTIMGLPEDMSISTRFTTVILTFLNGDWRVVYATPQGELRDSDDINIGHITLYFDAAAITAGIPITIGYGVSGMSVQSTQVEITTPFDGGASLTIGTDLDPDLLLESSYVNTAVAGAYGKANTYHYEGIPTFRLFPSGAPTVGAGRVTIYFN